MQKILLIDWEDTIIKSTSKFVEVKRNVAKALLDNRNQDPEYSEYNKDALIGSLIGKFDTQENNNMKLYQTRGFDNFRVSLMQVGSNRLGYDFFKQKIYSYIDEQIADLSSSEIDYLEGASSVIEELKKREYKMYIVTRANKEEQSAKIEASSIISLFDGIIYMNSKSKEEYSELLKKYKWSPEQCVMIGNSVRYDINPAKLVGMSTILVKNSKTWHPERGSIDESVFPATIECNNIREILDVL